MVEVEISTITPTELSLRPDRERLVIEPEVLGKLARTLSQNFAIRMREGKEWAFDFNTNYLHYNSEDLLNRTERFAVGTLVHEEGHVEHTDLSVVEEKFRKPSFQVLHNAIEDIRVNRLQQEQYSGAKPYLQEVYEELYGPKSEYPTSLGAERPHRQFCLGLIYEWFYGKPDPHVNDPLAKKLLEECRDDIKVAYSQDSAQESYEVIRDRIWPKYQELVKKSQEEIKEEVMDQLDREGVPWYQQESEAKQRTQNTLELEDEELNEKLRGKCEAPETLSDEELDEKLREKKKLAREAAEKKKKKGLGEKEKGAQKKRRGFGAGTEDFEPGEPIDASYVEYHNRVKVHINRLSKRLSSILKDNALTRRVAGYHSGKTIAQRMLWRIPMGRMDVFERKRAAGKKNYVFALIIDESGSMSGEKTERTIEATVMLQEVFRRIGVEPDIPFGIRFEVSGFDVSTRIHKKYSQRLTNRARKDIVWGIKNSIGGGTQDGIALQEALKRIKQQQGEERLIMMLTDGQGSKDRVPVEDVLEKIPKNVTVIGIGIGAGTEYVETYYPRHIKVEDIAQLPEAFCQIVRKRFKRGV